MFEHILNWKLLKGSHEFPGPDGGTCINEAAIVAAGFKYKSIDSYEDCPPCFSPVLSAYLISLNDNLPEKARQELLLPFVTKLAGTAGDQKLEIQRVEIIVMRTIKEILPIALRKIKLELQASSCEQATDIAAAVIAANAAHAAAVNAADAAVAAVVIAANAAHAAAVIAADAAVAAAVIAANAAHAAAVIAADAAHAAAVNAAHAAAVIAADAAVAAAVIAADAAVVDAPNKIHEVIVSIIGELIALKSEPISIELAAERLNKARKLAKV